MGIIVPPLMSVRGMLRLCQLWPGNKLQLFWIGGLRVKALGRFYKKELKGSVGAFAAIACGMLNVLIEAVEVPFAGVS